MILCTLLKADPLARVPMGPNPADGRPWIIEYNITDIKRFLGQDFMKILIINQLVARRITRA